MKSKIVCFRLVALHAVALTGFFLIQGCATGGCPLDGLTWPYDRSDDPSLNDYVIEPMDSIEPIDSTVSILLPPDIYSSEPYEDVTEDRRIYRVQKGDTLSSIASSYGTSWKELAEDNHLSNPHRLTVGQEIRIPGTLSRTSDPIVYSDSTMDSTPASVPTTHASIKQGSSYIIQRGDTLSGIAKRSGLTVDEIKVINGLPGNRIIAGKSLSIPKAGDVITTVSSEPVFEAMEIKTPENTESTPTLAPLAGLAPLATSTSAPVYEHILYPDETIQDVARQYGSSQEDIMLLNGITDPDLIKAGTKLLVPIPE